MDILIKVSQFVLSLSLLIVLHELGHFIPARIFKTRVEKFYLFFDPYFSLFKKKIGDTEYGIGWLPLGGYVKIAGMIDESMDTEQLKQEPKPDEFRSKPAWQRLIIMLGGVTVNIITAILIFQGMLLYWGEQYLPTQNAVYGITTDSIGRSMGFQNGDKILNVNGKELERFNQIPLEIILSGKGFVRVEREGQEFDLSYNEDQIAELIKTKSTLIGIRHPYEVGGFAEGSTAQKAGLELNDKVVAFNGQELMFFDQYIDSIPTYKGREILLTVERNNTTLDIKVPVPQEGRIGVAAANPFKYFDVETKKYGFFESFPAAVSKSFTMLSDYIRQFKLIVNPKTEAYKEVGGFIMIANQFDNVWNWEKFWGFTAFLSIMLAFINILPIPALDGGHVVFTLYEMIAGKPAPQKVLENAQMVGFVLLLGLIVLANGNDIMKLFQ